MRLITISRSFRQRLCLCSLNRTTYRFQLMRITIFLFVFLIVAHVFKGIDLIPSTDRRPRKEAAERSVWKPTCETNHVALIVATSDEAREASFFLKTLFFHRRYPLHLHIFVSEISHLITKTLMYTWELEQVSFTFYNVIKTKPAFSRRVMKYHIPSFIESSFADKIAFFENTVRLLDDVRSLLTQNGNKARGALGLVADHPCTKDQKWCFKDDIIVFDLKEFQLSHLQKSLVKAETEEEIGKILSKSHGDQIFSIPCEWAIALDKPSSLSHCLQRINSIRALVQSDLMPGFSSNPTLELASEHITTVLGSESPVMAPMECGPEFRRGFSDSTDLKLNITDRCAKFRHAGLLKRRTHLHYLGGSGNSQDNSKDLFEISLLTQLTLDRFGALERLLANWVGPAEVLFHLTDSEAMELPMKISGSKSLKGRKEVTYHVVYKRQKHNPINYLRNVLVNGSRVPFQFLVDVDLIPTPTLYKNLKVLVQRFMDKPNQKQTDQSGCPAADSSSSPTFSVTSRFITTSPTSTQQTTVRTQSKVPETTSIISTMFRYSTQSKIGETSSAKFSSPTSNVFATTILSSTIAVEHTTIVVPPTLSLSMADPCDNELGSPNYVMQINRGFGLDQPYSAYKSGFSDANGGYFIGLEPLYRMTNNGNNWRTCTLGEDVYGNVAYVSYSTFILDSESDGYTYYCSGMSGSPIDVLGPDSRKYKFTTYDRNNQPSGCPNQASTAKGGWWYGCSRPLVNMNGVGADGFYYNVPYMGDVQFKLTRIRFSQ